MSNGLTSKKLVFLKITSKLYPWKNKTPTTRVVMVNRYIDANFQMNERRSTQTIFILSLISKHKLVGWDINIIYYFCAQCTQRMINIIVATYIINWTWHSMRKNTKHKTILVESCMCHIQWKHEYANWLGEVNISLWNTRNKGVFFWYAMK